MVLRSWLHDFVRTFVPSAPRKFHRVRCSRRFKQPGLVCAAEVLEDRILLTAPVAVDDIASTNQEMPVSIDVLINDSDPDGDLLTITDAGLPINGWTTINTGFIDYTPNPGYFGPDSFTYTIDDGNGGTAMAMVTIDVMAGAGGGNTVPFAADDFYSIPHDTALDEFAPGVLGNDWDMEADPLTVSLVADVTNGVLTLNPDGSFLYVPNSSFAGSDFFTYSANDGVDNSNIATVTLDVTNTAPFAADDFYSVNNDLTLNIDAAGGVLSTDWDMEGDPLSAILDLGPTNGMVTLNLDGSFSYTPNVGFVGTDFFTYFASDGIAQSLAAIVQVDVWEIDAAGSFGFAWEGGLLDFFLTATSSNGEVVSYDVDIDGDGIFEIVAAQHDPTINGALVDHQDFLNLFGVPADNGLYTATLVVTNNMGQTEETDLEITIGNVPPDIVLTDPVPDIVNPGEVFTLTIATSDPGPDTITSLDINWGDGSPIEMYSVSAGVFNHIFTTQNSYTVTVTVTDEDTSNAIDWIVEIGDLSVPPPVNTDPEITLAYAEILPTGEAQLTVGAYDQSGVGVVSYQWDLDGDGQFLDAVGATVILQPGTGFFPYVAWLRVTDAAGNTEEALFAFFNGGNQQKKATKNTYKKRFVEATPELQGLTGNGPNNWPIHHTKQKVLAQRYLKEKQINVHKNTHLRALPRKVHDEITSAQTGWWRDQAKARYNSRLDPAVSQAMEEVPLAQVEAFEAKLEQRYSKYWIKAGEGKKIKTVQNRLKKLGNFTLGKAKRFKDIGLVFTGFAILDLITEKGQAAMNIANHTPAQTIAWRKFDGSYRNTLNTGFEKGYLTKQDANFLKKDFIAYLKALGFNDEAQTIDGLLTKQILFSTELTVP